MPVSEVKPKRDRPAGDHDASAASAGEARAPVRMRALPILITAAAVVVAGVLGWMAWHAYMDTPWTRDAAVRAYVVKVAPQVAGQITELPVADNQFVRKGDLLMAIDPINYTIAVSLAEADVQQAQANVQGIDAQLDVQKTKISSNEDQLKQRQAALVFAKQQADRYEALAKEGSGTVETAQKFASELRQQEDAVGIAQRDLNAAQVEVESLKAQRMSAEAGLAQAGARLQQAQVNLKRTRIVAPVDGYVTNLLAQAGDYVDVGANTISLVDAGSFWIDGYFEETSLAPIRVGDGARIKLMGYDPVLRGHVTGITRAISVANAQPNEQGVATVNPIFTWVRLAQRIPVRIHIDEVPPSIVLVAGMTATVEIDVGNRSSGK